MPRVQANGLVHHVQRIPAAGRTGDEPAPVVVLLHGMLIDSLASYYFTMGPAIAQAGFDVVLYDLRGHGRSTRPPTGYRLGDFLDDLDALLDALGIDAPVHLVGNSFGGTIAYAYAELRPRRVASIVAIEASPPTAAWAESMTTTMDFTANELRRPEVMDWIRQHRGEQAARLARAAFGVVSTTSMATELPASEVLPDARLTAVTAPVLAIYGEGEGAIPQEHRPDPLLPSCTSVVIPGHGHFVLINQPELVRDMVMDWLRARTEHDETLPA